MPDWFYRTVSQPILFSLPHGSARRMVLTGMGALGRAPWGLGRRLIDFLGHMTPSPTLAVGIHDEVWRSPIGASCWFDGDGTALEAWTRFGFGFVELGPVRVGGSSPGRDVTCETRRGRMTVVLPEGSVAPEWLRARLADGFCDRAGIKVFVRLRPNEVCAPELLGCQIWETAEQLGPAFSGYVLDLREAGAGWGEPEWREFWEGLRRLGSLKESERTSDGGLTMGAGANAERWHRFYGVLSGDGEGDKFCAEAGAAAGLSRWVIEGSVVGSAREMGPNGQDAGESRGTAITLEAACFDRVKAGVARRRERFGAEAVILAGGGVHQPRQAAELIEAGANGVMLDSGMVFSGPGLVKRTHEWMEARQRRERAGASGGRTEDKAEAGGRSRQVDESWFWGLMLGVAMGIGGLMAAGIASGRVLLPYDESFCGVTREQLRDFNPRLLQFMAHDRITLAGTMLAIGVMYAGMSLFGLRRGIHWARPALLWSGGAGFASFFLFLGFGYFDPFHGFVTAILFQLFVQCMAGTEMERRAAYEPDPEEQVCWRRGLWGQFLWVIHGTGLLLAGLTIIVVGVRDVFVSTDLEFLGMTAEALNQYSSRLIPLIAHDRVTLGGMLIAAGIPFLLGALWGAGRNARWLWWSLLIGGLPAYACAIGIHYAVGYVNFWHLLPAYFGLALLLAGHVLTGEWMGIFMNRGAKRKGLPVDRERCFRG